MDTTVLYSVISALWIATVALIALVYGDMKNKVKQLDISREKHEHRIQKIEDVQGNKIDGLKADFAEFKMEIKQDIKKLSDNIHKEKDAEQGINGSLVALNKTMLKFQEVLISINR